MGTLPRPGLPRRASTSPSPAVSLSSLPDEELPEPGGPGQSLTAAGILAISAASFSPDPAWLKAYLTRTLGPISGIRLPEGARTALIEQALEIASSPTPKTHAVTALNGYLSAASFSPSQGVPCVTAFLQADLSSATVYDARARESLFRFVTALRLAPRVVMHAEAGVAAFVHALAENATRGDGSNIEAVAEDDKYARRRRGIKWLKVGAAGVVGGLALGLSGGLIAPALIPALSGVGLAGISAPLTALGSGGAVAVGGLFGAAGAGVGAAAMASRTGMVQEFQFEPCSSATATMRHTVYKRVRISPRDRVHDVVLQLHEDDANGSGGLLVWEILTSQDRVMVVPGLISFNVGHRSKLSTNPSESPSKENPSISWLLPEAQMEVGGVDTDRMTESRRRRTTGAITVLGAGEYVLRFKLMPGSLAANVAYRAAIVPTGHDPPLWVLGENEQQSQELVTKDMRSLSIMIFVPGLITTSEHGPYPGMFADQFVSVATELVECQIQCFALRWETDLLVELSDALKKLLGKMAVSMAAQRGALMVVPALVGVAGVVALPVSIIGALRTLIGNIWARTLSHAEECGYMLAAELASRSFGNRPVVLAGYSAGALVVFSCLRELARRKLVSIVQDVCLIGAPCTADIVIWREIRSVVAGRLVNVFNRNDWYLELYHRGTNLGSVAGTRSIDDDTGVAGVENISVDRDLMSSHADYARQSGQILKDIGFGDAEKRRPWKYLMTFEEISDSEGEQDGSVSVEHGNTAETAVEGGKNDDIVLFTRQKKMR